MDASRLATPGVRGLVPYQPGKPIDELERELGIRGAIKLASNENPLGPSARAIEAASRRLRELGRYPDGGGFRLKRALSARLGVDPSWITLGNGSNDVLELVARAFASPCTDVVFSEHAFAVYPIVTQAVGARARVARARHFGHDLDAMRALITPETRIVFIANPNNPTGTWLDASLLEAFVRDVPEEVLVVVDEAYVEYAEVPGYASALPWVTRFSNLIVTRTFSKAYGLAGLRVGYGVSQAPVADFLNRVRQPFNVNELALAAAEAALDDSDHVARTVRLARDEMARVTAGLEALGLGAIPSAGNFLAASLGRVAAPVYESLLREGVIVRPVANYGMPEHLRVTLGLPEENDRLLGAMARMLNQEGVA